MRRVRAVSAIAGSGCSASIASRSACRSRRQRMGLQRGQVVEAQQSVADLLDEAGAGGVGRRSRGRRRLGASAIVAPDEISVRCQ
jgi:hypothetical protein